MRALSLALLTALAAAGAEPEFLVGVCTHFQQGKGVLDTNLSLMRQAGVQSLRDETTWNSVERVRGELKMPDAFSRYVDRAVAAGIRPLIVLDYGNRSYDGGDKPRSPEAIEGFVRYAEFVVRHFRGKVRLYEVWNEWDIKIGGTTPGDAESYTRLLAAVYPRIKKIDPSITVMAGAMTSGAVRNGWFDGMLAAGALASCDAVSIHSYNYSRGPRDRTPEAWAEFVAGAAAAVRKASGGRSVPLYVTEMGWPTHTGAKGTPPALSAAYLARMFALARTQPTLRGIWWYDLQDDGWKPEYNENNFGAIRPDGTPKPAYWALASISKALEAGTYQGRLDAGDPDLWILRFGNTLLAWYAGEGEKRLILETRSQPAAPVRVAEAGRMEIELPWSHRDWAVNPKDTLHEDRFGLTLAATPWIVRGVPADVTVVK